MSWRLHPQLAADTHPVASLGLSDLLLMDTTCVPWLILVPRIEGAREWTDLPADDARRLLDEVRTAAATLQRLDAPYKLNIGALGNMVEQLHVHVIGRHAGDAAWPRPAWGNLPPAPHAPDALAQRLDALRAALGAALGSTHAGDAS